MKVQHFATSLDGSWIGGSQILVDGKSAEVIDAMLSRIPVHSHDEMIAVIEFHRYYEEMYPLHPFNERATI